jgi:ribose transport system permease protein
MNKALTTVKNYALSVIAPVLMIVILLLVSPETRSWHTVSSLLQQGFAPAVLGWGVLFNMKVGNWDFSIGARIVLATIVAGSIAFGNISSIPLALIVFILLSLVLSLLLGVVVGATYKFLKIPTLIASIGICMIFESMTRILYNGNGVKIATKYMVLGKFPGNLIAFALCFALAAFIYYKRKIGYSVRAVGSNPTVAETNGINATNTKTIALILSGLFAGLYCILSLSKAGVCAAVSGTLGSTSTVFDAMMCVLIGMAICGKGNIIFSIYSGALITQVLKIGMMAIGLPSDYNNVVIAIFVILFMVCSSKSDAIKSFFTKVREKVKGLFAKNRPQSGENAD